MASQPHAVPALGSRGGQGAGGGVGVLQTHVPLARQRHSVSLLG
jgi:hypothetical protein